ncbi:MAG: alkaline phosphatase family protein, partial [Sediminibacterium sp.]|nr:alkaline phosphatase family protein [Sediminibacterium sp.]
MKVSVLICTLFISVGLVAQPGNSSSTSIPSKPKLVVGIVVDQMRWDYLNRYYPLFQANGGFRRMLGEGFSCENTQIPYTPSVTA